VELPILSEIAQRDMSGMPVALRRKLAAIEDVRWPRLANPREIIQELTAPLGTPVAGLAHIPHDRWDSGELADCTLSDALVALLYGFDLTWHVGDGADTIEVAPIQRPLRVSRSYNLANITASQLQRVTAELPAASVRAFSKRIELNGTVEDHTKLLEILAQFPRSQAPRRLRSRTAERQLFSLRLKNQPTNAVLLELARRLNLDLKVDEATLNKAGVSLDAKITVDVTQVDLETLLETIGRSSGLSLMATDAELLVAPR
jgi:hypothetical protein